jgi:hypothetical protein
LNGCLNTTMYCLVQLPPRVAMTGDVLRMKDTKVKYVLKSS